ncbi:hypothetical protein AGDE_06687 [Angomonas deanei]|nr:hypothetical protein AGDE_06687 [Angomonas deanei]|eukprot:EPY36898.1 hypothetical protein AGDE_06687 [Angomonas deanei]
MGRLRVTPKGKVKKNIPITRIGKKQYLKRRFAHVRATDLAGQNNVLTQKYFEGNHTAEQSFTRLGLTLDPSATKAQRLEKKNRVRKGSRRKFEEEELIQQQTEERKRNKIARPVSEEEGTVICNLLAKYGTNLRPMTMDPKLNPFQLNVRQLQRQITNYLKWERAAFPEAFREAEEKGWFSVEMFGDNRLRSGMMAQE